MPLSSDKPRIVMVADLHGRERAPQTRMKSMAETGQTRARWAAGSRYEKRLSILAKMFSGVVYCYKPFVLFLYVPSRHHLHEKSIMILHIFVFV